VQAFIEWANELFQRTSEPQCRITARIKAEQAERGERIAAAA
jgi:LysR family transcriptional regulator, regulator for bpeEF and oprC